MRILIDADACPVKSIIVEIGKHYHIPIIMFFDTSHVYEDGYSTVYTIDKGRDQVDFALVKHLQTGDIVVTQDYGVAAMALAKQANPINQNGLIFTDHNIEQLLDSRYTNQKLRKANHRVKGPKKRTKEQDDQFQTKFLSLVRELINRKGVSHE
jgi:uncharacterized protein